MKISSSFTKNIIVLLIFSCFTIITIKAQENTVKQKSEFWQKVGIGGGIGLGFGDGFFSGTLAPSAIYQFNDHIALGLGINASYNSRRDFYKSSVIGGSAVCFYNPIKQLQLSGEFEQLHVSRDFDSRYVGNSDDNFWSPALYLGAGFRMQHVTMGLRYDVLYNDDKSIYSNPFTPFIRVYF